MKYFSWNPEKNGRLKEERGVSFEEVVYHIGHGDLLDLLNHPRADRYKNQRIYVVKIGNYVYLVPFVEDDRKIFLKTIIPSRKATREYLR